MRKFKNGSWFIFGIVHLDLIGVFQTFWLNRTLALNFHDGTSALIMVYWVSSCLEVWQSWFPDEVSMWLNIKIYRWTTMSLLGSDTTSRGFLIRQCFIVTAGIQGISIGSSKRTLLPIWWGYFLSLRIPFTSSKLLRRLYSSEASTLVCAF